jgi:hypothetical protein
MLSVAVCQTLADFCHSYPQSQQQVLIYQDLDMQDLNWLHRQVVYQNRLHSTEPEWGLGVLLALDCPQSWMMAQEMQVAR